MKSHDSSGREGKVIFTGLIAILCIGFFTGSKRFFRESGDIQKNPSTPETPSTLPSDSDAFISPKDAWNRFEGNKGVLFLDIRSAAEFEQGHIPKSRPISLDALSGYEAGDTKTVIVVFSATQETLLPQAETIFKTKNISSFFLKGGFDGWVSEHLPVISIGTPGSFVDQSKITYLTLEQLLPFIKGHPDAQFLDVRDESKFRFSHAAGALNIPLADIEFRSDEIPRSKMILLYGENTTDAFRAGVRLADLNLYLVRVVDTNPAELEKTGIVFEK